MSERLTLLAFWRRVSEVEEAREALGRLVKRALDPLVPNPGVGLPGEEELSAEFAAFAEGLTPERFSRALRETPEGLLLLEGRVFLPYGEARAYEEGVSRLMGVGFLRLEKVRDLIWKLLPARDARRSHPAASLLDLYGSYLVLSHAPKSPRAWAWLLLRERRRVEEVLEEALLAWLSGEASRAFRELFEPWEVFEWMRSLWAFLQARRLMALDRERFFGEWRRHPGSLLHFVHRGSAGWEGYRAYLRASFALLLEEGWSRKEARWLLAHPVLTAPWKGPREVLEEGEWAVARRALALLVKAGVLLKPGRALAAASRAHWDLRPLYDLLEKNPQLSPEGERAVLLVLRAWGRWAEGAGEGEGESLVELLLTRALEAPGDFPREKRLSLPTLAERVLLRLTPAPLFPEPYTRLGLTAVELLTPSALEEEGRAMGHCLRAGSWTQVLKGRERFFSLRDWEGKRVATLHLRWAGERWRVAEVRGPGNAEVSRWVEDLAEELAQAASPREEVA